MRLLATVISHVLLSSTLGVPVSAIAAHHNERFSPRVEEAARRSDRVDPPSAVRDRSVESANSVFKVGLEALKWIGASSTQVGVPYPDLWCADFINFVLRRTGYATTNSRAARSFLEYGKRIDEPRVGAIVVLTRGKEGGHVGIVRGTDGKGNIVVVSGNHGNRVAESVYPRHRVLGYVLPVRTD